MKLQPYILSFFLLLSLTESRAQFFGYGSIETNGSVYNSTIINFEEGDSDVSIVHRFNSGTGLGKGDVLIKEGYLWAILKTGGLYNEGVIAKMAADGSSYQKMYEFNRATGAFPQSGLLEFEDRFYGITLEGGSFNFGVLFRIDSDGSNYTVLHEFESTSGSNPEGGLTVENEIIYGTTLTGGSNDDGAIFSYDLNSNIYNNMFDFDGNLNGSEPTGKLLLYDGIIWGSTKDNKLFSITTGGNNFTVQATLNSPGFGNLIVFEDQIYGISSGSGTTTLFVINPDGTGFTNLDFVQGEVGSSLTVLNNEILLTTTRDTYVYDAANGSLNMFIEDLGARSNLVISGNLIYNLNGTTEFVMSTDISEKVAKNLYYINSCRLGCLPKGKLIQIKDELWGVMSINRDFSPEQAVFKIKLNGSGYEIVKIFESDFGRISYNLVELNGNVWGRTSDGGLDMFSGTIFSIGIDDMSFETEYQFGLIEGLGPLDDEGGFIIHDDKLWGKGFNSSFGGILYSFDPILKELETFTFNDFSKGGEIALINDNLWMTLGSGFSRGGVIIFNSSTNKFEKIHGFKVGRSPLGDLTLLNGRVWGSTYEGGLDQFNSSTGGSGIIYSFDEDGSNFKIEGQFSADQIGRDKLTNPVGNLIKKNCKLWGITDNGSDFSDLESISGCIFSFDIETSILKKEYNLSPETGINRNPSFNHSLIYIGDKGTCDIDFDQEKITSLLKESKHQSLKLYPNPVNDILFIDSPDDHYIQSKYSINTLSGARLSDGTIENSRVDVSTLPPGIYFIKIEGPDREDLIKFIKQ